MEEQAAHFVLAGQVLTVREAEVDLAKVVRRPVAVGEVGVVQRVPMTETELVVRAEHEVVWVGLPVPVCA